MRTNLDPESRGIIFQGASANQLASLFRITADEVYRRVGDLQPVGTGRQGNPLYDVAEAAARLVKPEISAQQIDAYMRRVNHSHLPPMTSRFYWLGKKERDKYLETANELWFTDDIVRVASDSFQTCRMVLVLLPDALRDEAGLQDNQFRLAQRLVDDMIEDLRARLVISLGKPGRDPYGPGPEPEDGTL
jgi:hypothetical protein